MHSQKHEQYKLILSAQIKRVDPYFFSFYHTCDGLISSLNFVWNGNIYIKNKNNNLNLYHWLDTK